VWLENSSFKASLIELKLELLFMSLMKFKLGKTALVENGGTTLNNKKDQSMLGKNLEKMAILKCLNSQEIKMVLCQLQELLTGLTHG
jgi:hypothetical protein